MAKHLFFTQYFTFPIEKVLFFLASRKFFSLQVRNDCAKKKILLQGKKNVWSPYQENIFLASGNIQ